MKTMKPMSQTSPSKFNRNCNLGWVLVCMELEVWLHQGDCALYLTLGFFNLKAAAAPILYRHPTPLQFIFLHQGYALVPSAWDCCGLLEQPLLFCSLVLCVAGL